MIPQFILKGFINAKRICFVLLTLLLVIFSFAACRQADVIDEPIQNTSATTEMTTTHGTKTNAISVIVTDATKQAITLTTQSQTNTTIQNKTDWELTIMNNQDILMNKLNFKSDTALRLAKTLDSTGVLKIVEMKINNELDNGYEIEFRDSTNTLYIAGISKSGGTLGVLFKDSIDSEPIYFNYQ